MQTSEAVHVVFAVLGTQKLLVYGEDLLRHIVADGEAERATVVDIPIGRRESAAVLECYFAECEHVTVAEVLKARRQIPLMERTMARALHLQQDEL
jgi:hypothetical protein